MDSVIVKDITLAVMAGTAGCVISVSDFWYALLSEHLLFLF